MDRSWLNFIKYNNYYIKKNYDFFLKHNKNEDCEVLSDIGNINYTNKNNYNFFFDNFDYISSFAHTNFLDFKILPLVKPYLKINPKEIIFPKKTNLVQINCKKLTNSFSIKNYFYF